MLKMFTKCNKNYCKSQSTEIILWCLKTFIYLFIYLYHKENYLILLGQSAVPHTDLLQIKILGCEYICALLMFINK